MLHTPFGSVSDRIAILACSATIAHLIFVALMLHHSFSQERGPSTSLMASYLSDLFGILQFQVAVHIVLSLSFSTVSAQSSCPLPSNVSYLLFSRSTFNLSLPHICIACSLT